MARIVYSALVDSINGSIKGTTFQRNAYGFTAKGKPNMVNPNTLRQRERKTSFRTAVNHWLGLSAANKANWETYATTYPIPSRLNPSSFLNGFNAFVRWHGNYGVFDPSEILSNPSAAQGAVTAITAELLMSGGDITFEYGADDLTGTWRGVLYLSRPVNGSTKPRSNLTKYMINFDANTSANFNINTEYLATFGYQPVSGDPITMDLTFINEGNGQVVYYPSFIYEVF